MGITIVTPRITVQPTGKKNDPFRAEKFLSQNYLHVPNTIITTFFRNSNIPLLLFCASRTLPNKESQDGGGAETKNECKKMLLATESRTLKRNYFNFNSYNDNNNNDNTRCWFSETIVNK